ncbi:hypothetical protein NBRC116188_07160 [Oceaniserpentilla sp. 4NH20-0058]|uniref:ester cyclase n=1 Tax=Oceaniserpentilla sp. 4NH20-0058 TaxID=3127660 RepID=UPI003107AD6B
MEKSNGAIASMFMKLAWQKKHYNLLNEYVSKDFQYHTTFNERVLNLREYIIFIRTFHEAIPDLELTIEDVLVKDNKVVIQSILIGTIAKPFFGINPSGKLLSFSVVSTFEIEHGKIKVLDTLTDMAGVQRQIKTPIDNDYPIEDYLKDK